jgi:uncharacterized membrane protein YphA (DoxX/SURF4 family)
MIVIGIIFIVLGLGGYCYTANEMSTLSHSIDVIGKYFEVADTPMLRIFNIASIIILVLGSILLLLGIIKMIKD